MSTKKEEVKATSVEETKVEESILLVFEKPVSEDNSNYTIGVDPSWKEEEQVEEKPALIFKFDELEKAEDLEELLKNAINNVNVIPYVEETKSYIIGCKYSLTEEEFKYFTEVVYKIK